MNHKNNYGRFYVMVALHFMAMYVLMYTMVNTFGNVYSSLNQLYMAALMTASMIVIELWLMRSMYPKIRATILHLWLSA